MLDHWTLTAGVVLHSLALLLIMAGDVELNPGPEMDDTLTIKKDLPTVYEKLYGARTKWYNIGLSLKVDNETLKSIKVRNRDDPDECLREMLTHGLQADGPLTWREVCDCLRSPTVSRNDVAEEIEKCITEVSKKRSRVEPSEESYSAKRIDLKQVINLKSVTWKEIEAVFGDVVVRIKKSLEERNVQPKELVVCLQGCFHCKHTLNPIMFMQVKKQCEECTTITDFWLIISDYFTFYSYEFLKTIVNSEYASTQDKEIFKKYEEDFIAFSKKVLMNNSKDFDPSMIDGVTKVILKIKDKFRAITDEHLDEFKEKLATAIGVLPEHLHLIDLRPGCTLLSYHAPHIVEVTAFPLSPPQEAALIELGVIWLKCGKYKFPPDLEIPEDHPSDDDSDPDPEDDNDKRSANVLNTQGNSPITQKDDTPKSGPGSVVSVASSPASFRSTHRSETSSLVNESEGEVRQQQGRKYSGGHSDSGLGTSIPTTRPSHSAQDDDDEELDKLAKTPGKDTTYSKIIDSMTKIERNYRDHFEEIINDSHLHRRLSLEFAKHDNTRLHIACYAEFGNLLKVKACIELLHYDPLDTNRQGNTALHLAVEAGHLDIVRYLVEECHMSTGCPSETSLTPIQVASKFRHYEIVKYLIDQGVDPLDVNDEHETPLFIACQYGNEKMVKLLIEKARENQPLEDFINSTNYLGETILHCAVKSGNLHLVKTLISKFKTRQICTQDGTTPFCLAVETGNIDMVTYFLEINSSILNQPSAVQLAAGNGFLDILKLFKESKKFNHSSFEQADSYGYTPLFIAAMGGHVNCIEYLLEFVDGDIVDRFNFTPFHVAAKCGQFEAVKFLANRFPAHINKVDISELTPLHSAVAPCQKLIPEVDFTARKHSSFLLREYSVKIVEFLTLKLKCDPECTL